MMMDKLYRITITGWAADTDFGGPYPPTTPADWSLETLTKDLMGFNIKAQLIDTISDDVDVADSHDEICDNCWVDDANGNSHRCRADAESCSDGTDCPDYTTDCVCPVCDLPKGMPNESDNTRMLVELLKSSYRHIDSLLMERGTSAREQGTKFLNDDNPMQVAEYLVAIDSYLDENGQEVE